MLDMHELMGVKPMSQKRKQANTEYFKGKAR